MNPSLCSDERKGLVRRLWSKLFSRRMLPRYIFGLACLATLIALFYAEENWRGRSAWERCRRELEAKGAVLDWAAYIPAPVPDPQNIFKAPKMQEWFVRDTPWQGPSLSVNPFSHKDFLPRQATNAPSLLLAEVGVIPPDANTNSEAADAVLRFGDPAARGQVEKLFNDAIGPSEVGPNGTKLLIRKPNQFRAVRLLVLTQGSLGVKDITTIFPTNLAAPFWSGDGRLIVQPAGSNSFHILLSPAPRSAADYLAWSDQFAPRFDLLRQALNRPFARMDGDYQRSYAGPIPNFITVRSVAQMLAQRSLCYLMIGQPEAAARELTTLHDLSRLLDSKPAGKPLTLVASMIEVAITGLYTATIADGFRFHAWREPQLTELQQQLAEIDLLTPVVESFEAERAGACRFLETIRPDRLGKEFFSLSAPNAGLWEKIRNPRYLLFTLTPHGWVYQNMATVALLEQNQLESLDLTNRLIRPRQAESVGRESVAAVSHFSPYTYLAGIAVPNFLRATQTTARNQAMVNAALTACALERYRLAHGLHPGALDDLVPQFIGRLPRDPIGGQPLKYHRAADGAFILYSIGWNETDEGGLPGRSADEGDWVWGAPKL